MGNALRGKKRKAQVMKIDGSTVEVKPPAAAGDVLRDNPGYVLLDSDQVRQLGVRATPLHADHPLHPGKLYFLVQLPTLPGPAAARRARSAINVSAKDRLEALMLSRRSASDVTFDRAAPPDGGGAGGAARVRVRLPKAQVAQLLEESGDAAEAAEKILKLCVGASAGDAPARVPVAVREKQQEAELARLKVAGGGGVGGNSSQAPSSFQEDLERRLEEALTRAQAREEDLAQQVCRWVPAHSSLEAILRPKTVQEVNHTAPRLVFEEYKMASCVGLQTKHH